MRRSAVGLAITGIVGLAVLLSLGSWQVRRLHWKAAILSEITGKLQGEPVELPAAPDPATDKYLPVRVSGRQDGMPLQVWYPPSYRLIAPFITTDGRRIMIDRGLASGTPELTGEITITGNLAWPDETDGFTPAPDGTLFFARDVTLMAEALGTEPVLIVARSDTGQGTEPQPVGTAGIPNNHLQYAITWFSLAAIWAGMTVYALWRMRREPS